LFVSVDPVESEASVESWVSVESVLSVLSVESVPSADSDESVLSVESVLSGESVAVESQSPALAPPSFWSAVLSGCGSVESPVVDALPSLWSALPFADVVWSLRWVVPSELAA
jgi:hypothetical protein